MSEFEFPTNVKQIGSIGEGLRIYVEDYVCTYLIQCAESAGYDERIALLVGRSIVIDGQAVLFISGAIQGVFCKRENGISVMTERSWEYAEQMLNKHFAGLEIVGMMQSQPSYGIFLNTNYAEYYIQHFKKKEDVLFIIDPVEKVSAFYRRGEEVDNLVETKGYFIYYEKNQGMHEYMLENKIAKIKIQEEAAIVEKEGITVNLMKEAVQRRKVESGQKKRRSREIGEGRESRERKERGAPRSIFEQRKIVNMLVTSSAVLLLVVFIMGLGLIQNEGRIAMMEDQIRTISTAYREAVAQVRSDNNAEAVFASQNEDKSEGNENNEETRNEETRAEGEEERVAEEATGERVEEIAEQFAQVITESGADLLDMAEEVGIEEVMMVANEEARTETDSVEETAASQDGEMLATNATREVIEATNVVQIDPSQHSVTVSISTIPETYVVQEGDNLGYISLKFYGTRRMINRIMELNDMTDPDMLYFGKVIQLPKN